MKTINVDSIPEPVAIAMESVVEAVRKQLRDTKKPRPNVELPLWPGKVVDTLSRTEIYQDVR